VPDPIRGSRIIATVTRPIDEKGTLKKMAEQLPSIAMPSRFVVMPEMPKTGSGKIDFRTITEKVRDIIQSQ
jgi:acyl-[acyl-carrier-protein]-phospholipid O-acyltransferase/long-chain-fatty-acid--[acyl-carrier-protein] ligase